MEKSNNLQFLLMFFVFLFIVIGIGKYFIDIVVREEGINNEDSTELVTVTEDKKLSWTELSSMVSDCKVVQVSQTHDLRVSVVTQNDQIYWTYEPNIDDILKLASQASKECNMEIVQITE